MQNARRRLGSFTKDQRAKIAVEREQCGVHLHSFPKHVNVEQAGRYLCNRLYFVSTGSQQLD